MRRCDPAWPVAPARDFVREDRVFIYMEEYLQPTKLPQMFAAFCAAGGKPYGLGPHYFRNTRQTRCSF